MKAKPPIDPPTARGGPAVQREKRETSPERRRRRAANGRRTIPSSDTPVLVAAARDQLKSPSADDEGIACEYKDHVIRVERQRVGWRAAIYPKGSPFALAGGAYTPEVAGRDALIEQAKTIIDKKGGAQSAADTDDAAAVRRGRLTSLPQVILARVRHYLGQGWAVVKNIYFSVDRPLRRD
ncbi:MAG TPA: hypothetical protein VNK48_01370 [Xanthobacteraceae bacterium]|nr:hypothetical protein [Xanthobacteraceae bacterium]